jgi:flavin reductase (DIM6/NTAB) family NADH-FMN oxidoreductase RutF
MNHEMSEQPWHSTTDSFWDVMQQFASGVVVVMPGKTALRGVTVSAFSFVSRNPPMVSVTLRRRSRSLALLKRERCFSVSVLSADQIEVAHHFATAHRPDEPGTAQRPQEPANGAQNAPPLSGALGWLSCEVDQIIGLGDHELLLGRVHAAVLGEGRPLVRFAGKLYSDTPITTR